MEEDEIQVSCYLETNAKLIFKSHMGKGQKEKPAFCRMDRFKIVQKLIVHVLMAIQITIIHYHPMSLCSAPLIQLNIVVDRESLRNASARALKPPPPPPIDENGDRVTRKKGVRSAQQKLNMSAYRVHEKK